MTTPDIPSPEDYYPENMVLNLSFKFALDIIIYAEELEEKRKFVLAKQVLRSGTSVGANVKEAQEAESRADFIHKMKVAYKEADETEYWLSLCKYSKKYPACEHLLRQNESLIKILGKIISSSKK